MNESAVIENPVAGNSFEENYIRLRQKEGRVYTDEQLMSLPDIPSGHPHHNEWVLRKKSCTQLKKYLEGKPKPLKILEVGCGNGWLCRHLSAISLSEVTGTDINRTELQQAERVFKKISNLNFTGKPITEVGGLFDCIVFASSIQYFASLKETISAAMEKLQSGGEVHILDSPFYRQSQLAAATERTKNYFGEMGFPEMAAYYYHHCFEELHSFTYKPLYQPGLINRYLRGNKKPFLWVCIKKQ